MNNLFNIIKNVISNNDLNITLDQEKNEEFEINLILNIQSTLLNLNSSKIFLQNFENDFNNLFLNELAIFVNINISSLSRHQSITNLLKEIPHRRIIAEFKSFFIILNL